MATCDRRSRPDFSQLPAELIRAIYGDAGTLGYPLFLQDRVVALGVCKAWQAALRALPLARLALSRYDTVLCKWAILTRPSVLELQADNYGEAHLLPQLLHALPHKALRKLMVGSKCGDLTKALPFPAALPNLEDLRVGRLPPVRAWLGQLTGLRQLMQLKVCFAKGGGMGAPAFNPVQLPLLPSLVELRVELEDTQVLQLDLGRLLSLQNLNVCGVTSTLKVAAGAAPATKLRSLSVDVQLLLLDFAQLPALESARLGCKLTEVQGAASIAACTALSRLHLGAEVSIYTVGTRLDYPWVAELLGNVPSCLRQLSVGGLWTAEAAAAVGALAQLEDLSLDVRGRAPMQLPPEGTAVWRNLRAFKLQHGNFELPLPQVLSCSTRLEALYARLGQPSPVDLDLISSLPSFRKLALECFNVPEAVVSSTRKVLRRLMPQLQEVRLPRRF